MYNGSHVFAAVVLGEDIERAFIKYPSVENGQLPMVVTGIKHVHAYMLQFRDAIMRISAHVFIVMCLWSRVLMAIRTLRAFNFSSVGNSIINRR